MTDVLWNILLACGCGALVLLAVTREDDTLEVKSETQVTVAALAAIEIVVIGLLLFRNY